MANSRGSRFERKNASQSLKGSEKDDQPLGFEGIPASQPRAHMPDILEKEISTLGVCKARRQQFKTKCATLIKLFRSNLCGDEMVDGPINKHLADLKALMGSLTNMVEKADYLELNREFSDGQPINKESWMTFKAWMGGVLSTAQDGYEAKKSYLQSQQV